MFIVIINCNSNCSYNNNNNNNNIDKNNLLFLKRGITALKSIPINGFLKKLTGLYLKANNNCFCYHPAVSEFPWGFSFFLGNYRDEKENI